MDNTEKSKALKEIGGQIAVCTNCELHHSRKNAVPGEGPVDARIMLIGEGPGFHENEQGLPFVGASGKFLTELLNSGGLQREEVFITNVVKCRPPGNRDPQPDELKACGEYLQRQIDTINPAIIVTLGRFSMAHYIPQARISSIHGKARWLYGRLIVPMYHPAAALHQPSLRAVVNKDFAQLPELLEKAYQQKPAAVQGEKQNPPDEPDPIEPTQLSLF